MEIKRFKINKLHETLNFELKFENNTLILLGENGSCKTAIIKMLYYTLSLQWGKMSRYNFESIEVYIDTEKYKIAKEDIINSSVALDDISLRRSPLPVRRAIQNMLERDNRIDIERL